MIRAVQRTRSSTITTFFSLGSPSWTVTTRASPSRSLPQTMISYFDASNMCLKRFAAPSSGNATASTPAASRYGMSDGTVVWSDATVLPWR